MFFADATLDLNEAHDIADTPEPCRAVLTEQTIVPPRGLMDMPMLLETPEIARDTPPTASTQRITARVTSPTSSERTTSHQQHASHYQSRLGILTTHERLYPPRSPPRRPRDIPWAVSFVLLVPLTLFLVQFFQTRLFQIHGGCSRRCLL